MASTVILSILCVLFACCFSVVLYAFLKLRRMQECKKARFTNYDRLTGLGNKTKFIADKVNLAEIDNCAMVSIHLSRFMELYNLFGSSVSDKILTNFCQSAVTFACEHGGQAYRVAFDHIVLMVRAGNKSAFLSVLQSFLQNAEKLNIHISGSDYTYDFLLLYGVYFLSEDNDGKTNMSDILLYLDRKVLHSTLTSAEDCAVLDEDERPNWAMAELLKKDAASAWEKHEFVPYYQPIVNINTGKVVGSELLARWQHPTYGLLRPHQFIPLLESVGLIVDLDLYMIEVACKKIQYWLDNGILTVPLAINLSPLNVHRTDFIDRLVNLVTKYDIPPVLLELELPEHNLLFEDNDAFVEKMNYLHKKGFLLSMGHFAETDTIALSLLRKLPFDIIKLDFHFFDGGYNSERSGAYSRNFLELARSLNIKVVVTQLETEERVKIAQSFGCTIGKGFYFSKPLSSDEFLEFIT
ncbi:MAG: EAL domain-containing protein [Oscillospiraceae bacterium]